MEGQLPTSSFINLSLTAKGRYYWSIRFNFDEKATYVGGGADEKVATKLKSIDTQLRKQFPNNVADKPTNSTYKPVDMFDDSEG